MPLLAKLKRDYIDERETYPYGINDPQVNITTIPKDSTVKLNWTGADLAEEGVLGNICEIDWNGYITYILFEELEIVGLDNT